MYVCIVVIILVQYVHEFVPMQLSKTFLLVQLFRTEGASPIYSGSNLPNMKPVQKMKTNILDAVKRFCERANELLNSVANRSKVE